MAKEQPPAINSNDQFVNLHAWQANSRANGPGLRYVLWFQGCDLGCKGCFNPKTHTDTITTQASVADVFESIVTHPSEMEGITISGGEPLQQSESLLALLKRIRQHTKLSVILFSGYTIDEIRAQPNGNSILALIDVLIDGRYQSGQRKADQMCGSANQKIHLLSDRYSIADINQTPQAEVHIDPGGNITISGVNPIVLKN